MYSLLFASTIWRTFSIHFGISFWNIDAHFIHCYCFYLLSKFQRFKTHSNCSSVIHALPPFFIVIYNVDQPPPLPISKYTQWTHSHFECQTSTGGSFVCLFAFMLSNFSLNYVNLSQFFKWQIFNYIVTSYYLHQLFIRKLANVCTRIQQKNCQSNIHLIKLQWFKAHFVLN